MPSELSARGCHGIESREADAAKVLGQARGPTPDPARSEHHHHRLRMRPVQSQGTAFPIEGASG
jgi:hypothetical protein